MYNCSLHKFENCGLCSYHELVMRTIMITMVGAVKILHKEKTLLRVVGGRCNRIFVIWELSVNKFLNNFTFRAHFERRNSLLE
jgi:hypothetical protein